MQTGNYLAALRKKRNVLFAMGEQNFPRVRGGGKQNASFFFPLGPFFFTGRPGLRVKRPPTFWVRDGLRLAFGEKHHSLITA